MDQLIGKIVDNYKILEVIGRGGMGVVFKALDLNLEKIVALKMIDPFLARDDNFLRRFKTEAKALAKLENVNIVGVYALRETDFGLFMIMEYVEAKTISEWIREKGRFSISETIAIGKQILNAIGHAHKVGVIHRDIKPNNILLCEDGTIKVMDFGLAKVIQEHGLESTMTHAAAGTLYYMSPEQIKGLKNVDKRSDIYSIGMTLYEMLAGRTPFEKSESEFAIQKQIVDGNIPSPIKFNPMIPKDLTKIIMKCIETDAEKRFQETNEISKALSDINYNEIDSEEKTRIFTKHEQQEEITKPNPNKNKILISGSIMFIILAAILTYLMLRSDNNSNATNMDTNGTKTPTKIIQASLAIKSEPPGASVLINGKPEGMTPFYRDSLPLDSYSIMLKLAGYEDWKDTVYLTSSVQKEINANLKHIIIKENASLILNSVPSATIYIDDDKVLTNSQEPIRQSVSIGNHTVKFVSPEFGSKSLTVNLKNRQKKQITCYFQQQVNIQSLSSSGDPIWGIIYINDNNTNKTTPGDLLLGPGKYKITVKKTGYKTVEGDVELNIYPTLEPKKQPLVFHFK